MGWAVTWQSATLASTAAGQANYLNRNYWPASILIFSGTSVRVTLAGDSADYKVDDMYIGHCAASGDAWDFDGGQVRVTFDSGSTGCTVSAGVDKVSDEISFTLDETKNLLISYFTLNTSYDDWPYTSSNCAVFYKSGSTGDVATSDIAGMSTAANTAQVISKIEVSPVAATTRQVPVLTFTTTPVAPTTTVRAIPVLTNTYTMVVPTTTVRMIPTETITYSPVAPSFDIKYRIPSTNITYNFVTPIINVLKVPSSSLTFTFLAPTITGGPLNIYTKFPNMSGQHLSLKFYNNSPTDNLILYYLRGLIHKTIERNDHDTVFPNLSGTHLALKINQSADEDLLISWMSCLLLGKRE